MFKTVLFPIDASREAREAAKVVEDIVKTYNSRLILLSVVENPPTEHGETTAEVMTSAEAVEKLLESAKQAFAQQGIQAEIMEREGMPSFTICDVADELEANLIVMGSSGMGLTEEGVSESVTTRVINLSPCPVLIVP
ncbi:universal stress protein [Spirulina subsalsa FACHB-351]|uniref:Universal stress protein n=1 Tax=Spirulina subsalsa FACHB-351 TaxID=234711 RepID=A0ABT3L4X6_9CYAN|nr:universal stress protein [Spirulina subsalsa]MCW6036144.1 universal stress protein [Spirulina subsalsa FACHB-351]